MKVGNGVIGDEGSTIGGHKICKMGQKSRKWKNRQKLSKIMKKCLTFCLELLPLPSTQHLMAKKNEKVSWGGPWHFFSLFFWRFLPIFPFFRFLAHFAHFIPPYGRPLITCDPISYFCVSWVQLAHGWHCRQKKSMNFGFLKKNDHFSIFGHFDPWQPPYRPAN